MPPSQRQETLPERPGERPPVLIACAVAITERRAAFSRTFREGGRATADFVVGAGVDFVDLRAAINWFSH